jgi:hypothetical protein
VCPTTPDPLQFDGDDDGFGAVCDGCPAIGDDQSDGVGDALGALCDDHPFEALALLPWRRRARRLRGAPTGRAGPRRSAAGPGIGPELLDITRATDVVTQC